MNKISLAIIEDVEDIRSNLKEYFENQEEIGVVEVADSMEDFFERTLKILTPSVILSDIGLPGMSGIDGIKKIKNQIPASDVIMLTVFKDNDKIFQSICAGATGYVLKDTKFAEIKKAVIDISNGGSYMSPSIARKVFQYFTPVKKIDEPLTAKEKQIIQSLTDGLSYKLIADKLMISVDTVRYHIKNIYKKLHVNSKSEVVSKSLKGEI